MYSSSLSKVMSDTFHGKEADDGDNIQFSNRNLSVHDKYQWINELMQMDSFQ